jgi:hypothetical protein
VVGGDHDEPLPPEEPGRYRQVHRVADPSAHVVAGQEAVRVEGVALKGVGERERPRPARIVHGAVGADEHRPEIGDLQPGPQVGAQSPQARSESGVGSG